MRSGVLVTLLLIFIVNAYAMEVISGKVVSLDSENGEMVIEIAAKTAKSSNENESSEKPSKVKILFKPEKLPPCVKIDIEIRVWGDFKTDTEPGSFEARHIKRAWGKDPTGVRSRIGKCRKKCGWRDSGKKHHRSGQCRGNR